MKPIDLEISMLDAYFKQEGAAPMLLDLWAPWCGPCKAQAPALEALASAGSGKLLVGKIDVDQHPAVGERFTVRGIPTLILFKAGKEASRRTGVQTLSSLRQWMADEGLSLGPATVPGGGEGGPAPFGGAFYGDAGLRDFLVERTQQDAAAGRLLVSRFPSWVQGSGTVMASFARSPSPEIFERVTGIPASFGFCLEISSFTGPDEIRQLTARLHAGGDFRNVPARFMQRWFSDMDWHWPDLLGEEADRLRVLWLNAYAQLLSGTSPTDEQWAAIRGLAEKFDRKDPMQAVQDHFASMVKALSPLPGSNEASTWGGALLTMGSYLVFANAARTQGWGALDFAKELVLHHWFKAHCPDPRSKSREEMAALDAQFRAEHAEMLAIVEPKEKHFHGNRAEFMAPSVARLQEHVLASLASGG